MQTKCSKPDWLKIRLGDTARYGHTAALLSEQHLHTICASGKCPNQGECWSRGTATFMIGGDICTRSCKFCNTRTGHPQMPDAQEGERIAKAVWDLGLKYVVLTSVDRDDLPDYGASHWVNVIENIKDYNDSVRIEALIPDFKGDSACIERILRSQVDVVAHNLETVRRITPQVRSVASYEVSLRVIEQIAKSAKTAKSGIMVGLGETPVEVEQTMDDLLGVGCEILTIGQYLQPTKAHYPVMEYVSPEQFERYKQVGLQKGFRYVESGPLVRSSYHAENALI